MLSKLSLNPSIIVFASTYDLRLVESLQLPAFKEQNNELNALQIAEIARIVHYLKKHVVSKTIAVVKTQEDDVR